MNQERHLSETEQARLQRILAIENLESQKRIAYPFWALAGILFVAAQVELLWNPLMTMVMLPMAVAALMIGTARFGYYKLFRLIQYQNAVIENSGNTSSQDSQ